LALSSICIILAFLALGNNLEILALVMCMNLGSWLLALSIILISWLLARNSIALGHENSWLFALEILLCLILALDSWHLILALGSCA
jgi:hypothetical protein